MFGVKIGDTDPADLRRPPEVRTIVLSLVYVRSARPVAVTSILATVAMVYGVAAALSVLLQAHQMRARGNSCDVSARFLTAYVGGYAIWLLYGLSLGNVPIIAVDALGLVCGGITLAVALRLRGKLLSPADWNGCHA